MAVLSWSVVAAKDELTHAELVEVQLAQLQNLALMQSIVSNEAAVTSAVIETRSRPFSTEATRALIAADLAQRLRRQRNDTDAFMNRSGRPLFRSELEPLLQARSGADGATLSKSKYADIVRGVESPFARNAILVCAYFERAPQA